MGQNLLTIVIVVIVVIILIVLLVVLFGSFNQKKNKKKECKENKKCSNQHLPPPPIPDPNLPFPTAEVFTYVEPCLPVPGCLPNLAGKKVLVIGGSRGMGKATAITFSQAGAIVTATSRTPPAYPLYPNDLYLPDPPPGGFVTAPGTLVLSPIRIDVRIQSSVDDFFDTVVADPNGLFAGHIDI